MRFAAHVTGGASSFQCNSPFSHDSASPSPAASQPGQPCPTAADFNTTNLAIKVHISVPAIPALPVAKMQNLKKKKTTTQNPPKTNNIQTKKLGEKKSVGNFITFPNISTGFHFMLLSPNSTAYLANLTFEKVFYWSNVTQTFTFLGGRKRQGGKLSYFA